MQPLTRPTLLSTKTTESLAILHPLFFMNPNIYCPGPSLTLGFPLTGSRYSRVQRTYSLLAELHSSKSLLSGSSCSFAFSSSDSRISVADPVRQSSLIMLLIVGSTRYLTCDISALFISGFIVPSPSLSTAKPDPSRTWPSLGILTIWSNLFMKRNLHFPL